MCHAWRFCVGRNQQARTRTPESRLRDGKKIAQHAAPSFGAECWVGCFMKPDPPRGRHETVSPAEAGSEFIYPAYPGLRLRLRPGLTAIPRLRRSAVSASTLILLQTSRRFASRTPQRCALTWRFVARGVSVRGEIRGRECECQSPACGTVTRQPSMQRLLLARNAG